METSTIRLETGRHPSAVDITDRVLAFSEEKGDGLLTIFVPHATAGIAILETGSGTETDLFLAVDRLAPPEEGLWEHQHGSPGHGRDHVVPAFIAPSITIPVVAGRPALGTWQSVVLVDTNVDNPTRTVHFSFLAG